MFPLEVSKMNEIEILKQIIKSSNTSYKKLSDALGYKTASGLSNRLMGKTVTVEVLLNILSILDYELIIRNRKDNKESFIIDNTKRNNVKNYNTSKKL